MANDLLIAQYTKQGCVHDRNLASLLRWADYVAVAVIPAAPDETWVRNRIVAERIPGNIAMYVDKTLPYFMQDPQIASGDRLRDFLNAFNADVLEDQLANINAAIIGAFMPRFSAQSDVVTDQDVQDWYTAHGLPVPAR